jgi:hypothetical protein
MTILSKTEALALSGTDKTRFRRWVQKGLVRRYQTTSGITLYNRADVEMARELFLGDQK